MKITGFKIFMVGNSWKSWPIIKIFTDEGYYGIGESSLNGFAKSTVSVLYELEEFFIGKDPYDIEKITEDMFKRVGSRGGQIHKSAISSVEIACWDIISKKAGVPLYKLLGGKYNKKLLAYANGWYRHERTPENFAKSAKKVVKMGYKAIKFDPFNDIIGTITIKQLIEVSKIVEAIRDSVGNDVELMIEAHGRFTVTSAVRIARELLKYKPMVLEEPVPPENLEGLIEVSKRSMIPIAAGERIDNLEAWSYLLSKGGIQLAQPDIVNSGGISHVKKVAAIAESYGVEIAPHNAQSPISTAVCISFSVACPNFVIQETFDEFNESWTNKIFTYSFNPVDGYLYPSEKPGIGIDLIEELALKHISKGKEYLDIFEKGWETRDH